ncbi:hypothetical protein Rs2_40663 [Raphanus sativus]|nr:hypothetical protein Rs2_40663 [Raphanus sativus]
MEESWSRRKVGRGGSFAAVRAGSTILRTPVEEAVRRGLRMISDSAREYSAEAPSWRGLGREDPESESASGEEASASGEDLSSLFFLQKERDRSLIRKKIREFSTNR